MISIGPLKGTHKNVQLSDREQMIYIIAHILKVYDRVEVIQPGNSVWEIPRTLWVCNYMLL